MTAPTRADDPPIASVEDGASSPASEDARVAPDRSLARGLFATIGRALRQIDPALAVIVGAFVALQLTYLDYSPIWDTTEYAECLHDAVAAHSLAGLNCFRHPSIGYLVWPAIAQLFAFGTFWATHLVNVTLGALALVAFHRLTKALLPDESARVERLFATALLAMLPVVNGNLLNWTPDFGVYAFFVLFLAALVARRAAWAIALGLLLTFSKESGALMYVLALGCWLVAIVPGRIPVREWPRLALRRAYWLVPPVVMLGFLVARGATQGAKNVLWRGTSAGSILLAFVTIKLDAHLAAVAVGTFLLSFSWLMALVVVAALVPIFLWLRRGAVMSDAARLRLFFGLVLAAGFYALTRIETFSHLRYVLMLYPLYLLVFVAAASVVIRRAGARRALMAGLVVLFAASNLRTIDPVSRRIYGTFPFGTHPLLHVTSITGECCGYGMDGLTYDLEFANLDYLVDQATRDLKPTSRDIFAMPQDTRWWIIWRLDQKTFARTLERTGSFTPRNIGVEITRKLPRTSGRILFLEVPTADSSADERRLRGRYHLRETRTYERDGYRLAVQIFDGR